MSSNDGKGGVIIDWAIENFGSCSKNNIKSPFVSKYLNRSSWRLGLSTQAKDFNHLNLIILRYGINTSKIFVELSILGENGSAIKIGRGIIDGQSLFLEFPVLKSDVFKSRKNEFLPLDTLTVRCRLWTSRLESIIREYLFLRTKIQRYSFVWTIKDFEQCQSNQIYLRHGNTSFLTFELLTENDAVDIKITITEPQPNTFEVQSTCIISIIDGEGKVLKSQEDFRCPLRFERAWLFPSFITKSSLLENKEFNLPMGILTLRVDCFFYIPSNQINEIPIDNFQVTDNCNPNQDSQNMSKLELNKPDHNRFFQEMQSMFEDGILSDFTLTASSKEFKVHKNVLSVRSPVFRAMFTTDMKEKHGDSIDIPDVDADTLQKLLLFVYSNKVDENLQWESALQLYFAADKYAIDDLKRASGNILKARLCTSNACEVLVHADLRGDQDLKSTAKDFIVEHDEEIIGSEDWKELLKYNMHLTVEVLSDLYQKTKKISKK